jgi:hypothetical protein
MKDGPEPLRQQVRALVRQMGLDRQCPRTPGEAWIGVTSIDPFRRTRTHPAMPRSNGRLETLGSEPVARAFVWVDGSEPELWVDPQASGYRDLFDVFARTRLGLAGRPASGFNIDHVFPKTAGALDGLTHVRLMAIGAVSNQSAGRTLERAMAGRARAAQERREAIRQQGDTPREPKPIRHATFMTLGKATGFAGWEHLPDSSDPKANRALVQALFAHLAACGIHADFPAIEQDLTAHTLTRIH